MKFLLVNLALCSMEILRPQSKDIYVSDAGNWNNGPRQIRHFHKNENLVLISIISSNAITWHDSRLGNYKKSACGCFSASVSGNKKPFTANSKGSPSQKRIFFSACDLLQNVLLLIPYNTSFFHR
jgi:hypothetical protein